jgi:hypothetical protein
MPGKAGFINLVISFHTNLVRLELFLEPKENKHAQVFIQQT